MGYIREAWVVSTEKVDFEEGVIIYVSYYVGGLVR